MEIIKKFSLKNNTNNNPSMTDGGMHPAIIDPVIPQGKSEPS